MQEEEREIKQEETETGTKTLSGRQRKKDKHLLRNRNSVYFIHISIVRIAGEYLTVYNTKKPLFSSIEFSILFIPLPNQLPARETFNLFANSN